MMTELDLKRLIARRLIHLRELAGLSQRKMSKLTGISTRQIGRMEDPTYVFVPSLSLLLRIANFFEVPVISFIQEVE